jgi:hypothetical protein
VIDLLDARILHRRDDAMGVAIVGLEARVDQQRLARRLRGTAWPQPPSTSIQ